MKKYLLSLAGMALLSAASVAQAKEVTFDLLTEDYGLTRLDTDAITATTESLEMPVTLTSEGVTVEINRELGLSTNLVGKGLGMASNITGGNSTYNYTYTADGAVINSVKLYCTTFGSSGNQVNGSEVDYQLEGSNKYLLFTGAATKVTMKSINGYSAAYITKIVVEYDDSSGSGDLQNSYTTFAFYDEVVAGNAAYGLPAVVGGMPGGSTNYLASPYEIENDQVHITLEKNDAVGTAGGWLNWKYFANTTYAGLLAKVSSNEGAELTMTISVPNGKVKGFTMTCGASAGFGSLDINGTVLTAYNGTAAKTYVWDCGSEDGVDEVVLKMSNTTANVAINTLLINYLADSNVKVLLPADLEFSAATAEGAPGLDFTAPELQNPHDLAITWSSSNTAVATVDADGKVTIVGGGTAKITASTEGNEDYKAGDASYTITAYAIAAKNVAEILANAKTYNAKVYVNCPLTVVHAYGQYIFAVDEEGAHIQLSGNNEFEAGNVIPAGWVASCVPSYGNNTYTGTFPEASEEQGEYTIGTLTALPTKEEANNGVYILKSVTFAEDTSADHNAEWKGTLADGTSVTFYNALSTEATPAGTYDVTGAFVWLDDDWSDLSGMYVYPISYAECVADFVETSTTFEFYNEVVAGNAAYGLPAPAGGMPGTSTAYLASPYEISNDQVHITLERNEAVGTAGGWYNWKYFASAAYAGLLAKFPNVDGAELTMTITVPNGKVKSLTMACGASFGFDSLDINGTVLTEYNGTTAKTYVWDCGSDEGVDEVVLKMSAKNSNVVINSLEIDYLADPSVKVQMPAGIEFNASAVEGIVGKEVASAPVLANPNELEVTYTSSNTAVATVDAQGKLTLVGAGSATITATTEESEDYKAGTASYTVTVYNVATTAAELLEKCSTFNNKIYVDFPLTAELVNGTYIFATDAAGTAVQINASNSLSAGSVIPAGWTATCLRPYTNVAYSGTLPTSEETLDVEVTETSTVPAKEVGNNAVYLLKNVTFAAETPATSNAIFSGTLEDGSVVNFRNTFQIAAIEPGTYDILGAFCWLEDSFDDLSGAYFYPATVTEVVEETTPVFPAELEAIVQNAISYELSYEDDEMMATLEADITAEPGNVTVTITIPEGWDAIYHTQVEGDDSQVGGGPIVDDDYGVAVQSDEDDEYSWMTPADFAAYGYNLTESNVISLPVPDGKTPATYEVQLYLGYKGKIYVAKRVLLDATVTNYDTVGVSLVEAADEDAAYFTLDGVQVANPAAGLYIKVVNGEASKVVVK